MSMFPQIPVEALPDSALVRAPDPDAERGGEFLPPVEIGRVRYERASSVRRTDYRLQDATSGILYVDAVNSAGAFAIPAGSRVSVDGGASWMGAVSCHGYEALCGEMHHWEVELA